MCAEASCLILLSPSKRHATQHSFYNVLSQEKKPASTLPKIKAAGDPAVLNPSALPPATNGTKFPVIGAAGGGVSVDLLGSVLMRMEDPGS